MCSLFSLWPVTPSPPRTLTGRTFTHRTLTDPFFVLGAAFFLLDLLQELVDAGAVLDRLVESEADLRHLAHLDPLAELAADEAGGAVQALERGLLLLHRAEDAHKHFGVTQV